ncbi:hypothetical protein F5879DRAFT_988131 [Lentinula edodes]|nr:hypothetical protein F5051DRAFT_439929 [Lentinula edodes]KAJ3905614.1 hypothetical protein F5879DRAFT_988131 [Lentinula edodes]
MSPIFSDRTKPNGVYDRLAKSFADMGPAAIANAEVNEHFFRHNFGESWSANYSYRDCNSHEFSANVFGEVVGQAFGTYTGAQGNHYAGPDLENPIKITDSTKTKCTIVIACPTAAPPAIQNLFYNQICTFDGVREADKVEEIRSDTDVDVKEIVKSLRSGGEAEAIILTGEPLYTVLKKEKSKKYSSQREPAVISKSRLVKRGLDNEYKQPHDVTPLDLPEAVVNPCVLPIIPKSQEIYLGAEYDHRLMPDFGGPVFALDRAKLIQPNWRNLKNEFITPWMNYDALRPGVLVVANVGIRVYVLTPKSSSGVTKKIYHATINSLKVVAESAVMVTIPSAIAVSGRSLKKVTGVEPSAAAKALDAIDWFEVSSTGPPDSKATTEFSVNGTTDQDEVVSEGKRKKQRR